MAITKKAIFRAQQTLTGVLNEILTCECGGSSKSLADKAEITEAQLSRLRSGDRAPTAKTVGRIARSITSRALGDKLIAAYLQVVVAEVDIHRTSGRHIDKSELYPGSE
jgi:transcriptional regulator with XRE-family HTH domain